MIEFTPIPGIEIGPLTFNMHGLMAAIGVAVSYYLLNKRTKNKIPEEIKENLFLLLIISGIIGSRLLYVITHLDLYGNFIDILKIWDGGVSFLGGLILAVISAYIYLKKEGIDFLQLTDYFIVPLAVGHLTARLGDLLTWDHPGTYSQLPWAFVVNRQTQHPAILYEMIGLFIILIILNIISSRKIFERKMLFVYLGMYGLLRLINDHFRSEPAYYGLRLAQYLGLILLIAAIIFFISKIYKQKNSIKQYGTE